MSDLKSIEMKEIQSTTNPFYGSPRHQDVKDQEKMLEEWRERQGSIFVKYREFFVNVFLVVGAVVVAVFASMSKMDELKAQVDSMSTSVSVYDTKVSSYDSKLSGYDDKFKSYLKVWKLDALYIGSTVKYVDQYGIFKFLSPQDMENMRTDSNTIQSQIVVASSQINSIQESIRGVREASQVVQGAVSTCETKKSEVTLSVSQLQTLVSQLQAQVQQLSTDSSQQAMAKMRQDIYKAMTPPGTIAYFTTDRAPDGWLKANGQLVSRITYKDLFDTIGTTYGAGDGATTFALPDLRGEFVRGWDDGRGVDRQRTLGEWQKGSLVGTDASGPQGQSVGSVSLREPSPSALPLAGWDYATQAELASLYPNTFIAGIGANVILAPISSGMNTDKAGSGRIAGVSRPRNIALLACIKY
jgi:hypothetical protein